VGERRTPFSNPGSESKNRTLLVPLLIDTGSSLFQIKRRYLNHDQDFEKGGTPMAISASGEEIAIFGKVNKTIKFLTSDGTFSKREYFFRVIGNEILPGVAGLLGSDVLSKHRAVIDMGSKYLIFDD